MLLAFAFPKQVAFSGFVNGATYGVMAVGIVLVYRSTRVINLAVAEMGGFAAALLARMVINWDTPYWVALVACVAVGGSCAAVSANPFGVVDRRTPTVYTFRSALVFRFGG